MKNRVIELRDSLKTVNLETAIKVYDPIREDDLFSEAQLENFHRQVMKEVRERDSRATMRPVRTGVPPWRSASKE